LAGIGILKRAPLCTGEGDPNCEDPNCEILHEEEAFAEPENQVIQEEQTTEQSGCRVSSLCFAGIELMGRAPMCTINTGGLVEEDPNCEILRLYKEWFAELGDQDLDS
jgi:hypothetical protein